MPVTSALLHVAQVAFSAITGYHAYIAITNLQQYEEKTKKAGKYVEEANRQLYRTRTTQGAGAVAVLTSLISAVYLLVAPPSESVRLTLSAADVLLCLAVNRHMRSFWQGSVRAPGVTGYNEALKSTEHIMQQLPLLA
ncbi:hypothetical protein LTS18_009458, partial [Coniosporium uncinatum]